MTVLVQSNTAKGKNAVPYPDSAGDVVAMRTTYALSGAEAVGTIVEMGVLPPNCRLIDAILDADAGDADASKTLKLDVGIMSGEQGLNDNTRTMDAAILAASVVAQAGGVARPTLASAFRTAPADVSRGVGIKIQTAAATGAACTLGLTLLYATA